MVILMMMCYNGDVAMVMMICAGDHYGPGQQISGA